MKSLELDIVTKYANNKSLFCDKLGSMEKLVFSKLNFFPKDEYTTLVTFKTKYSGKVVFPFSFDYENYYNNYAIMLGNEKPNIVIRTEISAEYEQTFFKV